MTKEWLLFTLICAITICSIVIASLVKCYYCKKLKQEKELKCSDKRIVDLLKEIYYKIKETERK